MAGLTIPEEKQESIRQLMEAGFRNSEISQMLQVSRPTVSRYREAFGFPPANEVTWGELDQKKWEWLQKNWHFKKPKQQKPKRKPTIKTPDNYYKFGKEDDE